MRRYAFLGCILSGFLTVSGCVSSGGIVPIGNVSQTELRDTNFSVTRTNLRGEASCGYVFGMFPVGDTAVASRAMDQLVQSAETAGKPTGLINFAGDTVISNYFFYKVVTVVMRADAVEFK